MAKQTSHAIKTEWHMDVPNDRMAHLIRDAGRLLAKSLQNRLVEHGVSFGHWSFLRILWVNEGLTQRQLSEKAGVMEPTTFTALKAMESIGLIERRRLEGNRRKLHIFLTQKGRDLKGVLTPLAEEVNRVAMEGLSSDERNSLRQYLLLMINNLIDDNQMDEAIKKDKSSMG